MTWWGNLVRNWLPMIVVGFLEVSEFRPNFASLQVVVTLAWFSGGPESRTKTVWECWRDRFCTSRSWACVLEKAASKWSNVLLIFISCMKKCGNNFTRCKISQSNTIRISHFAGKKLASRSLLYVYRAHNINLRLREVQQQERPKLSWKLQTKRNGRLRGL